MTRDEIWVSPGLEFNYDIPPLNKKYFSPPKKFDSLLKKKKEIKLKFENSF